MDDEPVRPARVFGGGRGSSGRGVGGRPRPLTWSPTSALRKWRRGDGPRNRIWPAFVILPHTALDPDFAEQLARRSGGRSAPRSFGYRERKRDAFREAILTPGEPRRGIVEKLLWAQAWSKGTLGGEPSTKGRENTRGISPKFSFDQPFLQSYRFQTNWRLGYWRALQTEAFRLGASSGGH